ncbi:MAG: DMT family transporter, partial [Burkholderiaceae bacterium]
GKERPRPAFWLFAILGSACVGGFALGQDAQASWLGDLLMLGAILTCGYGYAEGGRLSRHMGGWEVISWALALSLPFMAALSLATLPQSWQHISLPAWISLGYVSLFSMLIGFFFWYRGLAQGGIAAVGQLQLLQPFMGLALAAALLGESVSPAMMIATIAVVACVAGARLFAKK